MTVDHAGSGVLWTASAGPFRNVMPVALPGPIIAAQGLGLGTSTAAMATQRQLMLIGEDGMPTEVPLKSSAVSLPKMTSLAMLPWSHSVAVGFEDGSLRVFH